MSGVSDREPTTALQPLECSTGSNVTLPEFFGLLQGGV